MSMTPKTKRSGGPRTPEGKQVASRNAIKSGAYSQIAVLPGEDPAQFEELERQFIKDFAPADLAESMMVSDLAVTAWKKLRLLRIEQRALIAVMNQPVRIEDLKADFDGPIPPDAEKYLNYLDTLNPVWDENYQRDKDFAERMKHIDRTKTSLQQIMDESLIFGVTLMEVAERLDFPDVQQAILDNTKRILYKDKQFTVWRYVIEKVASGAEELLWVIRKREEIMVAIQRVKDKRLLELVVGPNLSRAFDHLDRSFYKTLAELRKHQATHRRPAIDGTSTRIESDRGAD